MNILRISLVLLLSALNSYEAFAGLPVMAFWQKPIPNKLVVTTPAPTLMTSLCSNAVGIEIQTGAGAPMVAPSSLTITLAGPTSLKYYSDAACTQLITTTSIAAGANSTTIYFSASTTGSKLLTIVSSPYLTATQTATITTNPYIWVGSGSDAAWSTAGNWSGGAVPGASDIAIFDATCASNCSPTLSADTSVGGVRMVSTYAGTITQGGNALTIGSNGWTQSNGTFVGSGSGSAVTLNGSMNLAGGTYTATTGSTTLAVGNWTINGAPTFNANLGTLIFGANAPINATIKSGTVSYHNVTFGSAFGMVYTVTGSMTVVGALSLEMPDYYGCTGQIDGGTINAYGSISISSTCGAGGTATVVAKGNPLGQTISGTNTAWIGNVQIDAGTNAVTLSGTIRVQHSYTYTSSGTFTTTGSTLAFLGDSTGSVTPGTVAYNNVTFTQHYYPRSLGGGSMTINGTLSLAIPSYFGCFATIDNGNLLAYGDVSVSSTCGAPGTATVVMKGNPSGQTLSAISGTAIGSLEIAAGTNPVTLSGTIQITQNYTYTSSGAFTTTGTSLIFKARGPGVNTITPGNVDYNDVTFSTAYVGSGHDLGGNSLKVKGTLSLAMADYYGCGSIANGTLQAYGNVNVSSTCGGTGNYSLEFLGSSSPTLTVTGGSLGSGNVTVNLTAGQALWLGSAASWNNTGQSLTVSSGGINLAGFALTVKSLSLNGNTLTKNSGTLTVNGVTSGTGSLYGGTVNP